MNAGKRPSGVARCLPRWIDDPHRLSGSATDPRTHPSDDPRGAERLAKMKEGQQQVLILGYFEGLTSAEIAERLRIPEGTVKSRTRAALDGLRRAFGSEKGLCVRGPRLNLEATKVAHVTLRVPRSAPSSAAPGLAAAAAAAHQEVRSHLARSRPRAAQLLNWLRARGQFAAGTTDGFNNKARITTRKAYGLRICEHAEIALYHGLGNLPEPDWLHRFT